MNISMSSREFMFQQSSSTFSTPSPRYDRRLVAYDASGAVGNDLVVVRVRHRAHLAGINCLAGIKVDKDTCLLATGGFDSYIKVWNDDLTLFYRLHDVPELKTGKGSDGILVTTSVCLGPK
ncbi:unnamed protein product [Dibothriocephalus latus]|uniref:Uncharacterized protein n=1 Tax=Dibothriocephalus latus TaxID=60516 RepID=A0A3P7PNN2_DIBLA|nr:unnamed protein product [Dibothriocephalus latus]